MTKELMEKRNDLITRAEEILNKAKEEKRELTEEESTEITGIRDNVRAIDESDKLDEEIRELGEKKPKEQKVEAKKEMTEEEQQRAIEIDERNAFENYIRGYEMHENVRADMTKSDNGAIIPKTIVNYIIKKVYDICPILDRSQKFNVKGTLSVPYYPADSNNITVAYQTEFVAMTGSAGKFNTVDLTGYLAGALTKISRSLINNVEFNIVDFVVDEMAYAIKRFIEHEMLIGTSGKVTGLSTLTHGITAAAANAVTADEIVKLHDSIKDEFQENAVWIMSPATRTALRTLKSNTGYYLLNDDISTPFGSRLLGKPVYVSDNMPDMATGVDAIYYGDLRGLASKFNENINIQVLREKYADEHAYGVIGWFEFDSKVIDEQQLAKLTMA